MQVLILRHGETDADNEDRTLGWIDKSLNQPGILMAENYANFLKRQQQKIDLIMTSPLTRARQTALIISRKLNAHFIENELIKERNFGELSGLTWEEFTSKFPELAKINTSNYQEHLPHGESIPEVTARVEKFVNFLYRLKVGQKYSTVMVVTHTDIMRILLRILLNYTPEQTRNLNITNLTCYSLEI